MRHALPLDTYLLIWGLLRDSHLEQCTTCRNELRSRREAEGPAGLSVIAAGVPVHSTVAAIVADTVGARKASLTEELLVEGPSTASPTTIGLVTVPMDDANSIMPADGHVERAPLVRNPSLCIVVTSYPCL